MIRIIEDGDLTVEVGGYEEVPSPEQSQEPRQKRPTFRLKEEFMVSREKLASASTVFKSMVFKRDTSGLPGDFSVLALSQRLQAVPQTPIRITDTHPKSIEIWFRAIRDSGLSQNL